jgi:hypothetical protein
MIEKIQFRHGKTLFSRLWSETLPDELGNAISAAAFNGTFRNRCLQFLKCLAHPGKQHPSLSVGISLIPRKLRRDVFWDIMHDPFL